MRRIFPAVLFLLPVMILIPYMTAFPFTVGSLYSDMAVSHFPNSLYIQRVLFSEGGLSLWSPAILSGYPLVANPLSGLFYPPGWPALLLPLPFGMNLMLVLHLLWGGLGMYHLLRAEDLSPAGALLGALTFTALPKLYSHLGAGHVTLIYAVSWTPWLLAAEQRSNRRTYLRFLLPGAVLALIALADVRWAAYAGLFWLAYSLRGFRLARIGHMAPTQAEFRIWLAERFTNVLFALLAALPLLLPLAEYTRLSTRASLTAAENLILSLPPEQLLGLVYPPIGGAAEWVLYPGAAAAVLALYALCVPAIRLKAGFWLGTILVTLIVALGASLPLMALILRLPGLDLLRVPPRVLFLTGLSFAAAASYAADALMIMLSRRESLPAVGRDRSPLVLFAAGAFVALLGAATWLIETPPMARIQFSWGAFFFAGSVALVLLARSRRCSLSVLVTLLLTLNLVDLVGVNGLSLVFQPAGSVLSSGQAAAAFLHEQPAGAPFRVYSPSYSIPQQVSAWYGLELADGVDPLQLETYTRFMQGATGVPRHGYSVTLPPFAEGDPQRDNAQFRPDPARLGLLNVRYVVAEFPLAVDGLHLLAQFGDSRIYENQHVLPRAWVQPAQAALGTEIFSAPEIRRGLDWIALEVSGPGLLVLSELAYPGWQVSIDAAAAEMVTPGGLLRGVLLPAGPHVVRFTFRPLSVYWGVGVGGLAWLAFLIFYLLERKHRG